MEINKDKLLEIYDAESTISNVARKYCKENGIEYTDTVRRYFSTYIRKNIKEDEPFKEDSDIDYEKDSYEEEGASEDVYDMPSAWNPEEGKFYNIDQYCDKYGLPREQVRMSKLVAHREKHMIYNILFKETLYEQSGLDEDAIKNIVEKLVEPVSFVVPKKSSSNIITNLTFTDTHVGMEPDKDLNSMYGGTWNKEELESRMKYMVEKTVLKSIGWNSNILYVRDLGDLADGYNGETARGGHNLPQNMDNVQIYDAALSFKVKAVDMLVSSGQYSKIICHNICNSNHGGDFDYFINKAQKEILEIKYDNVEVINHRKFISHYGVGEHCFVISHGKDSNTLKFGFKPFLDAKTIERIDQYIKDNSLYNKHKYFHFCKGDSHKFLFDFSTSQDFDYLNYPAFSPSSQWVQNNFKKGISGFVLEGFNKSKKELDFSYKEFSWT